MSLLKLTTCVALSLFALPSAEAEQWKASVAKIKITPTQPIRMGGFAFRKHPSEGVLSDLWAKALVLQDADGNRIVLITVDVNNISRDISQFVCKALTKQFDLPRSSIALNASHTHSGPAMGDRAYYVFSDDEHRVLREYTENLKRQIVSVATEALRNVEPVNLSWSTTRATFAGNRRNNRPQEIDRLKAEGKLKGPVDHDVPVLIVRDLQGKLKAVICGYACHATTISTYKISADWPGAVQLELEQRFPEIIAMTWIGCGGDQNPVPRRKIEHVRMHGKELADAVAAVVGQAARPIRGTLAQSYREIAMPFADIPTREELQARLTSKDFREAARAKRLLEYLDSHGEIYSSYPYPVQVWKLGDGPLWILLGGEVVVDYSLRLKIELGRKTTWIAGYCNDVLAYIPSERVLREGGYEGGGAMVLYGHPSPWARGIENRIVAEVHRQVKAIETTRAASNAKRP